MEEVVGFELDEDLEPETEADNIEFMAEALDDLLACLEEFATQAVPPPASAGDAQANDQLPQLPDLVRVAVGGGAKGPLC